MTDNDASRDEQIRDISERFSKDIVGCGKVFADYDFTEPMEMFVGVTCHGAICALAEADRQTLDEFLTMAVDTGIETATHVLGALRATLVFDPGSFTPVGQADYKAGIARHLEATENTTIGVVEMVRKLMEDNPGHAVLVDPRTGVGQLIPIDELQERDDHDDNGTTDN